MTDPQVAAQQPPVSYPAYCPHHLGIHTSQWCTAGDHVSLDPEGPGEDARRKGFTFYHGDVITLRDSSQDPKVGDVVGDKRALIGGNFHLLYVREVVKVGEERIAWCRPGGKTIYWCSRKTWRRWASGSWRCTPKGKPTRRTWRSE